jgi:hypothetical protein
MARRVKQSHYEEKPLKRGSRLSPPAPPPGRDPHLGKQAVRFIAERWVGELVSSDRTGQVVLKAKGKREITLDRLIEMLSGHEGFQVELTVFEDADPDVAWRIGEAVRGVDEESFTWEGPSIYVARIVHEFTKAFPDRTYDVQLSGQTITIDRLAPGPRARRFTLESPDLGTWDLIARKPGRDDMAGFILNRFTFASFAEVLSAMKGIESTDL